MENSKSSLSQQKVLSKFDIDIDLFLNNKNLGVLIVDINDDIVFVNEILCGFLGYSSVELVGSNLNEHNENQNKDFFNEKAKLRKNGSPDFYKISIKSKHQEIVNFILNTSPLYKNNKHVGNIGIFINISDNRIANESSNIVYNFTDFLSQTIVTTNFNLNITNIEKYGLNFLDIKEHKFDSDTNIFDLIERRYKPQIELFVKKPKGVFKDILGIKIFDNQVLNVYSNIVPIYEQKKIVGFKFIFTDLSQFTELKHKFERSEQQYKLIFQKSQSALLLFDNEIGKVFEANYATAKLIGKETNELIDLKIDEILKTKTNESVFNLIKKKNVKRGD